jgi:hypothetical protein
MSCANSQTQQSNDPDPTTYSRGLYVDGFDYLLGDSADEDALLSFAQHNLITSFTLYDLHNVWDQGDDINAFIEKAKDQYGILEIGAAGENTEFFENAIAYNATHTNQFDVLNLEYEYWNNDPTDLDVYLTKLDDMQTLADANGLRVEAYIGWPESEDEMAQIASRVDRLLVHAYVESPNDAADYLDERLTWIANQANSPEVCVIFSVEDEFMGPWVSSHSIDEAEEIVMSDLEVSGLDDIVDGFQYFTYSLFVGAENVYSDN